MEKQATIGDGLVILGAIGLVGLVTIVVVSIVYDRSLLFRGSRSEVEIQAVSVEPPAGEKAVTDRAGEN